MRTPLTLSLITALFSSFASAAEPESTQSAAYLDKTQPVDKRVEDLVSRMTLEEKIYYIGGKNNGYDRIQPLERLGIPPMKMADGPMGCRNYGPTTAYPGGIALAATWDPEMARKIGVAMGRDCRARGVHIFLMPAVNIYRSPLCGRNFEYMGEDPCLTSTMVAPLIQGVQSQEVLATVKHFACNNQEWDRHHISSEVDERTLREIYLPAFKAAVQQGNVACVMNAYNLLNGVHCSQSDFLLHQVLKGEWGFKGFVMSDWGSTYDGVAAAKAGLDLEMPNGKFMNYTNLAPALQDGRLSQAVLDDKLKRIFHALIGAGFLDRSQTNASIQLNDPDNARTALAGARESIVLLKNIKHALPLERKKLKSIAVLGPNATPAVYGGGGSGFCKVFDATSVLDGIKQLAGDGVQVLHTTEAQEALLMARKADVAVVCVGFNSKLEGEGHDRPFDLPAGQTNLIHAIAEANPHTIVVVNSGGGVAWAGWLDKVPAVLQAWYSGQGSGRAVAEILFGELNPSGKLPATFEKKWEDNPTAPYYLQKADNKTPYTEGIFVGYRGYDQKLVEPQFCFGHGLSYTEFRYSKPQVTPARVPVNGCVAVSLQVENVGKRAGDEVVELYSHQVKSSVPRPPKELRGFQRVGLQPGEKKTVTLSLAAEQLAYYDVKKHAFVVEPGAFDLLLGSSSRDLRGKAQLEVVPAGK